MKDCKYNNDMWMNDSDMIFGQITHGDFPDMEIAEKAICAIYVPDMTISRAGICHALGRLEKHYAAKATKPTP